MLVERLLPAARNRLVTIRDDASLVEAAKLLRPGTDLIVVCDQAGHLAGVITKTDVVAQLGQCQEASCAKPASSVMTRDVVVCHPDDWINEIWSTMKWRRLKNVPITDPDSRPIGILTARDALEILLEEVESEDEMLRDYVMNIGYQ